MSDSEHPHPASRFTPWLRLLKLLLGVAVSTLTILRLLGYV